MVEWFACSGVEPWQGQGSFEYPWVDWTLAPEAGRPSPLALAHTGAGNWGSAVPQATIDALHKHAVRHGLPEVRCSVEPAQRYNLTHNHGVGP